MMSVFIDHRVAERFYNDIDDHLFKNDDMICNYVTNEWKPADIIGIKNHPNYDFWNDGKYLWSGLKLVPLDTMDDEHLNIPSIFCIGNQLDDATYWQYQIQGNNIVYAYFEIIKVENLKTVNTRIENNVIYIYTFDYPNCFHKQFDKWLIITVKNPFHFDEIVYMNNSNILEYNYDNFNFIFPHNIDKKHALFDSSILDIDISSLWILIQGLPPP